MAKTIGCIGCGNMGSALLTGFAHSLDRANWRLLAFDQHAEKCQGLSKFGVTPASDVTRIAQEADIIILAVKPDRIETVTTQIAQYMDDAKAVISIAAGTSLAKLRNLLGLKCKIARCMPTTTARVERGIFAFCFDPVNLSAEFQQDVLKIFSSIGACIELAENRFTDFSAFIGAGPAYIFQFMQGLAQAGITLGFGQAECKTLLIDLFAGCAKLARQASDKNFTQLRDDVCSPAGLTIAGINVLERAGINGLLVDAVLAAKRRGSEMEN